MSIVYHLRSPSTGMSTMKAGCLQCGSPPQQRWAQSTYSPAILWRNVSSCYCWSWLQLCRTLQKTDDFPYSVNTSHSRTCVFVSFSVKPDLLHPRGLSAPFANPHSAWLVLVSKFSLISTKISSLPSGTSYPPSLFLSISTNISIGFKLLTCFCQGQGFCFFVLYVQVCTTVCGIQFVLKSHILRGWTKGTILFTFKNIQMNVTYTLNAF